MSQQRDLIHRKATSCCFFLQGLKDLVLWWAWGSRCVAEMCKGSVDIFGVDSFLFIFVVDYESLGFFYSYVLLFAQSLKFKQEIKKCFFIQQMSNLHLSRSLPNLTNAAKVHHKSRPTYFILIFTSILKPSLDINYNDFFYKSFAPTSSLLLPWLIFRVWTPSVNSFFVYLPIVSFKVQWSSIFPPYNFPNCKL